MEYPEQPPQKATPIPEIPKLPEDASGFPKPPRKTSPWTPDQQRRALAQIGWTGISNIASAQEEWLLRIDTNSLTETPEDPQSLFSIVERLLSFGAFWDLYPRHEDRRKARNAFFAKCRTPAEADEVVDFLENGERDAIIARSPDVKYRDHPTTWINAQPWREPKKTKKEIHDAPLFTDQLA